MLRIDVAAMDFRIIIYDLVDSTLDVARKLKNVEEFTIILAKRQSKGRGRFNREWASPLGGLWFTTILYPQRPAYTYSVLSLLTSLSVSKAIEKVTGLKPSIRWPNDVYLNNKKTAGVLIESEISGDIIEKSLVGIGVNVNFRLEALPMELRDKATTLLEEYGEPVDEHSLLTDILIFLREYYGKYKRGQHNDIIADVKKATDFIGNYALLDVKSGKIKAFIKDLDTYGNIIIESDGIVSTLTPNDVERMEVIKI